MLREFLETAFVIHRKQLCHKPTAYLLNIAVVQRNEQRQLIVYD